MREDIDWMRRALELAEKGVGWTQPNPCVGAVIVRDGRKLGEGYHRRAGQAHAEEEAINKALSRKHSLAGATMYVTLEPCSTQGKTPPCTDAIIQHGFSRVVVGTTDPNPKHSGRGYKILRKAGIEVTTDVLRKECEQINIAWNFWMRTGRPWVIAKAAMSLDGFLAVPGQRWVTGKEARKEVHKLRAICDAILVGANTVRRDNPRLTVRGVRCLRQPWRVVMTKSGELPQKAYLFKDRHRERTLVFQDMNWKAVLKNLSRRDVVRLLVEGGGQVLNGFAEAGLINEVWIYYAPFLAKDDQTKGKLPRADALHHLSLRDVTLTAVGQDLWFRGFVK